MKLIASKGRLLKAMQHVIGSTDPKSNTTITACIKLMANADSISITSTNLTSQASEQLEAKVETQGAVAIRADTLMDIVKSIENDQDIELSLNESTQKVTLKSGNSKFDIKAYNATDFPMVFDNKFDINISMESKDLINIFAKTSFAMSNNPERFNLNGIMLHSLKTEEGLTLVAVSTDGHRLAVSKKPMQSEHQIANSILPRHSVMELSKILAGRDEAVKISISSKAMSFEIDKMVFTTKLLDAQFPDYQKVIPQNNNILVTCNRVQLLKALNRISAIHRSGAKKVTLNINADDMTIDSNNGEGDIAHDKISIQSSEHQEFSTSYNPQLIQDVLNVITSDTVILNFLNGTSPALIQETDNISEQYIIMPIRQ